MTTNQRCLIDTTNPDANWHDVLELWYRLANWTHCKPSDRQMNLDMKFFMIALLSEKDWLSSRYPLKKQAIETFISASEALSIVADLANTTKHRVLQKRVRSHVQQTGYYGRVGLEGGASRKLQYLRTQDGRHVEIMTVLRCAMDELEEYRFELLAESLAP